MFSFSAGDLVLSYQPNDCNESRGIVLQDQKTMNGYAVVQVLWKLLPKYRSLGDEFCVIGWERVETLAFISKLTTEELLLHDHPAIQAIGKQRARDEGFD